jgi:hypothetical protein
MGDSFPLKTKTNQNALDVRILKLVRPIGNALSPSHLKHNEVAKAH